MAERVFLSLLTNCRKLQVKRLADEQDAKPVLDAKNSHDTNAEPKPFSR